MSLSIANLARGAVLEQFEIEVQHVLNNISDPNYPAGKKRKITITLEIVPNEDRDRANITCKSKAVLAEPKPIETRIALEERNGITHAKEYVSDIPGQIELEDIRENEEKKLRRISG